MYNRPAYPHGDTQGERNRVLTLRPTRARPIPPTRRRTRNQQAADRTPRGSKKESPGITFKRCNSRNSGYQPIRVIQRTPKCMTLKTGLLLTSSTMNSYIASNSVNDRNLGRLKNTSAQRYRIHRRLSSVVCTYVYANSRLCAHWDPVRACMYASLRLDVR